MAAWDNKQNDKERPIFKNEYGKIYVRRNGYVEPVKSEKEIEALKNTNFSCRQEDAVSLFEVSDDDFFSYDEEDD